MAELPPRAQQLLANNKTWVEKDFKPYPTMKQLRQLAFDGKQRAIIIRMYSLPSFHLRMLIVLQ